MALPSEITGKISIIIVSNSRLILIADSINFGWTLQLTHGRNVMFGAFNVIILISNREICFYFYFYFVSLSSLLLIIEKRKFNFNWLKLIVALLSKYWNIFEQTCHFHFAAETAIARAQNPICWIVMKLLMSELGECEARARISH